MNKKIFAFLKSKGLIIGGLFMIAISIIIIFKGIEKKRITEENRIVNAKIIESPVDCDNLGRRGGYYKLQFNGKTFVKNGNRIICESMAGKKEVAVFTNEERNEIILINEYKEYNLWSGVILILVGSIISIKGGRKGKQKRKIWILKL